MVPKIGIGIKNIWYRKKVLAKIGTDNKYRYQKHLLPEKVSVSEIFGKGIGICIV